MAKVLFYSSVKDLSDFESSLFYKIDIRILKDLGFIVEVTNKLSSFLKFRNYDIAFIYFYRKGFVAGLIARIFNKRVFFTGGIDDLAPSFASRKRLLIQRILFGLCYCISTRCLIVSKSDYSNIRAFWKLRKKISVVFHAIEVNDYNPDQEKHDIITTISWMGSIANVKRKGVDLLIKGFAIFRQKYPSFILYIIGKPGEGCKYLQQVAKECNLTDGVKFCGSVTDDEKISILSRSKYYGQISQFEGFGLSVLEAMASGCIVLHSGKGGLQETVGGYGVLIKNFNNPKDLAAKMVECELSNGYTQNLARNAFKRVQQHYDYSSRHSEFGRILIPNKY